VVIVGTLLRWIDHVSKLGRVAQTTETVEHVARKAMCDRHCHPYLGGQPFTALDLLPDGACAVSTDKIGYIAHIDMKALSKACDTHGCEVYVGALPGKFVDATAPLAWVVAERSEEACCAVRDAFTIGEVRSFDQDPRFGVAVLSEIASRALSPAMNDPGTAIDVLGRTVRLLALWSTPVDATDPEHACVHVPPVLLEDLFEDAFTPIARDGAGHVEVMLRLQKTLRSLSLLGGPEFREAALHHSAEALQRAEHAMPLEADRARVRKEAKALEALHAGS